MTKADLVDDVANAAELTKKDAERLVEIVFESIIESLNQGEKIELRGFGSFRVRERGARRGRNPKTGQPVSIPPDMAGNVHWLGGDWAPFIWAVGLTTLGYFLGQIDVVKNNIEIAANTPDVGEAKESLAVNYKGREFSIAFNPEFFMAPLRALTEDEVFLDLIDEMSPGVLKIQTPFLYVLMPMRISS